MSPTRITAPITPPAIGPALLLDFEARVLELVVEVFDGKIMALELADWGMLVVLGMSTVALLSAGGKGLGVRPSLVGITLGVTASVVGDGLSEIGFDGKEMEGEVGSEQSTPSSEQLNDEGLAP